PPSAPTIDGGTSNVHDDVPEGPVFARRSSRLVPPNPSTRISYPSERLRSTIPKGSVSAPTDNPAGAWTSRNGSYGRPETTKVMGVNGVAVTATGHGGPFTPPQTADAVGTFGCCAGVCDATARIDTRLHTKRGRKGLIRYSGSRMTRDRHG